MGIADLLAMMVLSALFWVGVFFIFAIGYNVRKMFKSDKTDRLAMKEERDAS